MWGYDYLTIHVRSERLIGREDAQSVKMSVKHFSESLQCNLTEPDSASYGIASLGVSLTVIFPFMVLGTRQSDKWISLQCRFPVVDLTSNWILQVYKTQGCMIKCCSVFIRKKKIFIFIKTKYVLHYTPLQLLRFNHEWLKSNVETEENQNQILAKDRLKKLRESLSLKKQKNETDINLQKTELKKTKTRLLSILVFF